MCFMSEISEKDLQILKILQENCRLRAKEISKEVGTPISTVFAKTKRMESEGIIKEYTNLGSVVEVTVDVGLVLKALISKRSFLELNLSEGKHVHVGFKAASVRIVSVAN